MHTHKPDRNPAAHRQRQGPRHTPTGAPGFRGLPHNLLTLQATLGNAAVVQMLRRADRLAVQESNRHGVDCAHQRATPTEVQRSSVHDVLNTPGRPLDAATRVDMEARLGADFTDVRLHTDSAARASATEVGALAYTSGNHVVIDGGDKYTLAHELTHVIQQRQGSVSGIDMGNGLSISSPDDRFERAAERNAQRVMSVPLPKQLDTGKEFANAHSSDTSGGAAPIVQRMAENVDIKFRTKTLPRGTVVFKGGAWPDGEALAEAAESYTTNGEWGACYLGTPANISVGYMEEKGHNLLTATLKRDLKLLEIYGTTADSASVGGDEKARLIKELKGYEEEKYLMDSILGNGYDGAYMSADADGSGKEVILHWAMVGEACTFALASKQPHWNKMGYFDQFSDDE